MSEISEGRWKQALGSILEELDETQYMKLLMLSKIKRCLRDKPKEEMPEILIQHYGVEKSITAIRGIMEKIPRRDEAVQSQLKPFVDELKAKKKKGFKRKKVVSDPESSDEEQETDSGAVVQQPLQAEKQSGRITIKNLEHGGDLEKKIVTVKVLQKSGLRTYKTKQKQTKYFFYLGVADETGSCKVMVYGKQRYQDFEVDRCYGFRQVIKDGDILKVTIKSIVSKVSPVSVCDDLKLEAQMIIHSQVPLCSIAEAKGHKDGTTVSVEGTITTVGVMESVKTKFKRRKTDRLQFQLADRADSIWITLWGDGTKQLTGKSSGDSVRVTNVKTNNFHTTVSLKSTDFTRIFKVQSAAAQSVSMKIIGIISAGKIHTELESEINSMVLNSTIVSTYVVTSSLLAKVFSVKLGGDFEERLLEKLPLEAEAEIEGNKIIKIRAAKEM
ncbi:uncharacterized protein LOC114446015 [Parambassis ranga]|uniref:Uncharacterized protein LOC114446015 n=1 Tax=Parambassis ranga TaxID=210632 RepID=A0A6P7JJQ1_9TELE|nr:uncharacterized protein LOC114446015 [Parambassis ranga]XP_028277199.1 uncharacterized protein LOC114446015 [Parambassis ranga]XP_028277200.1 uncharacterized protein LOC114446015 [Parambassis ranga]XP_028277201.1 uncharacterized protein LOC114446015 [Parambassis ranga]XP_028277203.1 uncharacterized protein LOC114446015 [Parambassis ranga]